jgi:hypothetical protein
MAPLLTELVPILLFSSNVGHMVTVHERFSGSSRFELTGFWPAVVT